MFRRGRFEIFKDAQGQWRFRLRATNGAIVAQSEGYTRKDDAREGCRAAKRAAHFSKIVEVSE